jgi:hypothetical protein
MLLDREWPWVEREAEDLDVREEPCPRTPNWEREELGDQAGNADGRVAEVEKLVHPLRTQPGVRGWSEGGQVGNIQR